MNGITKSRLVVKILALVIFANILITGGYFVHADTAGPNLSELYPAVGSTIEAKEPKFSVRFYDPDMLDPAVVIQADGQSVTPTVAWDGIYETYYDSCTGETWQVRVGDDYTKGVVNAQFPRLTVGQHTVYYRLKDRAGNITENTYTFSIQDTTAPTIADRFPAAGATISGGFPTIMVKLSDANNINASSIAMTLDGSPVVVSYDPLTKTLTYKHSQVLLNGSHAITLTAADEFGNSNTHSWSFTVNDITGPSIANLIPTNNSFISSTSPTIQASITDPSGVASQVEVNLDGSITNVPYNSTTGKFSFTPTTSLAEGKHSVSIKTADLQGNQGTASWVFYVDLQGPALSEIFPQNGATIECLRPQVSLRFSDPAKLDTSVVLQVYGLALTPSIAWDGIYEYYQDSCTGELYPVRVGDDYTKGKITGQSPKLAQGQHTFYYKVKDRAGNVSEGSNTFTVSDTIGPRIASATPAPGSIIASGYPVISATLTDGNNIVASSVYLNLNGTQVSTSYDAVKRTISYTPTEVLLNGNYTAGVFAKDEVGNKAYNTWSFTVDDVTPPTISQLTPAPNSIIISNLPTIEAQVSDSSGIKDPVYFQLDGKLTELTYNALTGKATYLPPAPLTAGNHSVIMTVYDNQGQKSSASWSFYIDRIGPELSNFTPAHGTSVTTVKPKISVDFYDPSQFDATRLAMSLDGTAVTPVVTYEGIYEKWYDSCTGTWYDVRVGDDYTRGTISYQSQALSNNKEHTVLVTVYDKPGNYQSQSWTFLVHDTVAPGISDLSPPHGTKTENSLITVSAKASDNNGVDPDKTKLMINGVQVGAYNGTTGVLTYTPSTPYTDGYYTVTALVYDLFGNFKDASWNFTIGHTGPPEIKNLLPTPGSGTRTLKPTISAWVYDVRGIDTSRISLTVDGILLKAGFIPDVPGSTVSGKVYGVPTTALSNAMHDVVLTVFDLSDNAAQKKWQFGVNQFGDMSVGTGNNCTTCHNEGIAAIEQRHVPAGSTNCAQCHTYTVVGSEPDCCYCHDGGHTTSWPPAIGAYACTECHNTSLAWLIPIHGSSNEIDIHNYAAFQQDCKQCHSSYLTREHNVYVEGKGVAYDCNTCHKSTNTTLTQAITNHNRACTACHGIAGTGHDQFHDTTMDSGCLQCHNANISTEHLYNTKTQKELLYCGTCHYSTDPKVTTAISNNDVTCKACHSGGDHEAVHTSGLDSSCLKCHAATLTADHITNRPELGLTCDSCHNPDITGSAAVAPNNIPCSSCHMTSHGLPTPARLVVDIPLYSGYKWSVPMDARVWAGESWMPQDIPGAKVVTSNRSTAITGDEVWTYYKTEMAAGGWQLTSSEPVAGSHFYTVTFTKNNRKAVLMYYGGENGTDSPEVQSGHRVQLIYN